MPQNPKILISEALSPLLIDHGFSEIELGEHLVAYQKPGVMVAVSYNSIEESLALWVGSMSENRVELTDEMAKVVFGAAPLDHPVFENCLANIVAFLAGAGSGLLVPEPGLVRAVFVKAHEFASRDSKELLQRQWMDRANRHWERGEFVEFLEVIGQMNLEALPKSWAQRVVIARKRVGGG